MKYKITFKTGAVNGAGTDSNIFVQLIGSKSSTSTIQLNTKLSQFEKNSVDEFYFETSNLGNIEKIILSHDEKLFGSNWFLNEVFIEENSTKTTWFFPFYNWINFNKTVELKPAKYSVYYLEIITGNLPGSGTNDEIEISIIGDESYTPFLSLNKQLPNLEFKTGHTNHFSIIAEDVGKISEIKLRNINSKFNSNWYLSKINLKRESDEHFTVFPFHTWIKPGKINSSTKNLIEYTIKFETGDVAFGGTDANVFMILHGTKGQTETIKLNELIARNAFEAGNTDYVKIASPDIGHIKKLNIWHDEKWLGDGWFLNKISIRNDKTKIEKEFPYYSWLDKSADPKSVNIELTKKEIIPRPFYAIAHMVNTPSYVEEALDLGSNAVEFDVTPKLDNDGEFCFEVFHGFRPDLDPDKINLMERSIAKTELSFFLRKISDYIDRYNNFSLVIIDCKLEKVPHRKLKDCGQIFAKIIKENLYKSQTERLYSIISIPKRKFSKFLDGIKENLSTDLRKYIGFDLSMESFQTTENYFNNTEESNAWWGSGIASTVPKPLRHFIPQFLIAAKKRTKRGVIKKIYYWTLDDPDSMARILVTKLDGIIVNDPLKLLKVLEKNEFKYSYRLATREDNPFKVS